MRIRLKYKGTGLYFTRDGEHFLPIRRHDKGPDITLTVPWEDDNVWQIEYNCRYWHAKVSQNGSVMAEAHLIKHTGVRRSVWQWRLLRQQEPTILLDRLCFDWLWGVSIETERGSRLALSRMNCRRFWLVYRNSWDSWGPFFVAAVASHATGSNQWGP